MPEDISIKASELSDYVYCPRGWWLRYNGQLGENEQTRAGTAAHERLANILSQHKVKVLLAWGAILIGIIALLLFTLLLLLKNL